MFSNQITARELLNGSQGQSTQDRMMSSDFSQLQNAQMTQLEISLANSQEFFSQDQFSTGNSVVPCSTKRPSVIDKYISKQTKPSLFSSNSQSKISTVNQQLSKNSQGFDTKSHVSSSNYVETLNFMKAKARERDERDMLNSIVSIVQECSDEVKTNLSSMKMADKDHIEGLKASITSLTELVDESSMKILNAVKQRDHHANDIALLHKELRQKDEQIKDLLKKIQTDREESSERSSVLLDSLKCFLTEQHTKTEQRIQKVLETTQEQLKQIKEFGSSHRNGLEENSKLIMDLKYSNVGHVQDIEKRLVNELVTLKDELDHQKRDMESFVRSQLHSNQQKHSRDFEKHIQKGLAEGLHHSIGKQEEYFQEKYNELENFYKAQNRAMEKYIKSNISEQTKQLIKQSQDIQKDVAQNLKLVLSNQKESEDENKKYFSKLKESIEVEKRQAWQNDNVPQVVQDRLDELHNQHQSEIKRLREEIESKREVGNKEKTNEQVKDNVLQNVYNFKSDEGNFNKNDGIRTRSQAVGSIFKKGSTFLSPKPFQMTTWNSRAIFSRTDPSPIATVRPQRQQTQNTISEKCAERAVQAIQPITAVLGQPLHHVNNQLERNNADNANVISNQNGQAYDPYHNKERDYTLSNTIPKTKTGKNKRKRGRKMCRKRKTAARKHCREVDQQKFKENISDESTQPVGNASGVLQRKVGSVLQTSNASSALYDFHDETSPVSSLRKNKMLNKRKVDVVEPAVCDNSSDESSASTSSVWSVSDLFESKVKDCVESPENVDNTLDFLSSPSLMEISCEMDKQVRHTVPIINVVQEQPPSQCRKQKRRLYSFDMTMMQFVKRSRAGKY